MREPPDDLDRLARRLEAERFDGSMRWGRKVRDRNDPHNVEVEPLSKEEVAANRRWLEEVSKKADSKGKR